MGKYLSNISLEEGLKKYLHSLNINKFRETEYVDVEDSLNRMSSEAIYANLSAPFYNCSAMDGIAVKAESTFLANEQNMVTLTEEEYLKLEEDGAIEPDTYYYVYNVTNDAKVYITKEYLDQNYHTTHQY